MLLRYRHIFLGFLLLMAGFGMPSAMGQFSIARGPMLRKKLHERFLRIVRGGDGYLYVFKGTSGHFWNFGAEGERSLQILRFSPDLVPVDTLRIRRWGPPENMRNAYEVLPTPTGIGVLTIARSLHTGMPALILSEPVFGPAGPTLQKRQLDDLPGLNLGLDQPGFRYAYSPDSNWVLLAWRRLARDPIDDNSLACMILDRNLEVVKEPFLPFKRFDKSVSLREMYILDPEHLLFTAQTYTAGTGLQGPPTISFGLVHYAVGEGTTRIINFSRRKQVPVEMRILVTKTGRLIASGWYLDQENERREAGVFIGEVTGADTLEALHCYPFPPEMRDALIRREKKSGAVSIRSSYNDALLSVADAYIFVLHLRGLPDKGIVVHSPGIKYNNTLHTWVFDRDYSLGLHEATGFLSLGREEMMETFSWRPLQVGNRCFALAADYSKAQNEAHPFGAENYAWDVSGYTFDLLLQEDRKEFAVLAAREMVQVSDREWVGIAVSGKKWRLVSVRSEK